MAIDIEAPGADEADLKAAIQALANDITVVTVSASGALDIPARQDHGAVVVDIVLVPTGAGVQVAHEVVERLFKRLGLLDHLLQLIHCHHPG